VKSVYFPFMHATLTELRRETSRVLRPVIHGAKTVMLTEHGQEVAAISPKTSPDRKRALKLLTAIGPVELPARR
jgi:antitoxin (DNA-binding transcriptional repressor) of toxin-antitoxin stability system